MYPELNDPLDIRFGLVKRVEWKSLQDVRSDRTEEENEHYTALLENLAARFESLNQGERDLADLPALLIEDFESRHYELPKATPVETLQFLMDQHKLKQRDLLDILGTPSVTSDVLSGKRELSKEHIRRLVARFPSPPNCSCKR